MSILYLDSAFSANRKLHDNLQKIANVLRVAKGGKPEDKVVYPFYSERPTLPQQLNDKDCGFYVIEYVARFMHDPLQVIGPGCVRHPEAHHLEANYFHLKDFGPK